jgi:hypothetical protein
MPDIGSGLSDFGQQLSDVLGSLFGSGDDALPDSEELEKPDLLDEEPESQPDDELEDDELDEAEEAIDPAADSDRVCETPSEEPPPVEPPPVEPPPVAPPPEPAPTPAPLPPPEPAAPPEPMAATGTPCEIAADELPQVGS